ncbi:hypothetical protein [Burkholderia lata]|uniref:hypothetical protein n=1 Tax=Burkholderia lata (strain ATCC 17760 / DSM 23089 / LMG 22485 / NCIMB 9086 / R18194 / 383) TaxID=482957 RepID=UPI00399A2D3E
MTMSRQSLMGRQRAIWETLCIRRLGHVSNLDDNIHHDMDRLVAVRRRIAVGASISTVALGAVALIVITGDVVVIIFSLVKLNRDIADLYLLIGGQPEKRFPGDYGDSYLQSSWQVFPGGLTS